MYNTKYLIEKRRSQNLTQQQVADYIGMAQPNYSKLEAGNYATISPTVLKKLHELLNLDIYCFLLIGGETTC